MSSVRSSRGPWLALAGPAALVALWAALASLGISGARQASAQDIPIKQGRCYCPTSASTFGANAACGAACGGGGIAGRFVTISAKRAYTPLLSSYGATSGGYIIVSNVVQTE